MSINRVIISGNLTRDPELRSTASGLPVLGFGVAVNDRRKNQQTGEWEDYPNFIDCTMFGARAESLSRYLDKGAKVSIEGKLRWSQWERDGQKRSKLTYGTDVSGVFTGGNLNLESVETFSEDAGLVQLYFPSQTGRLLVPVTRAVFSDADPTTAVLELAKGPQDDSGLERALPENCGVKSVTMKDGVVTVNFSKEFKQAMESSDGGQQAVRAILFTCSQFPGVKKVEVQVEGEKIEAEPETATTFINAEEEVIAQYPGVVELD